MSQQLSEKCERTLQLSAEKPALKLDKLACTRRQVDCECAISQAVMDLGRDSRVVSSLPPTFLLKIRLCN